MLVEPAIERPVISSATRVPFAATFRLKVSSQEDFPLVAVTLIFTVCSSALVLFALTVTEVPLVEERLA